MQQEQNNKVLVGMSGGVDSAVAAYLLQQDGYEPTGVNCRFFNNDDAFIREKTCCSLEDANDARSVAYQLGIPFYVFNFTDEFRQTVIEPFVYEMGNMDPQLRTDTALMLLDSGNQAAITAMSDNMGFVFDDFEGEVQTREDIVAWGEKHKGESAAVASGLSD